MATREKGQGALRHIIGNTSARMCPLRAHERSWYWGVGVALAVGTHEDGSVLGGAEEARDKLVHDTAWRDLLPNDT